jgi:hypothetical protein
MSVFIILKALRHRGSGNAAKGTRMDTDEKGMNTDFRICFTETGGVGITPWRMGVLS